jgi:hypothetical protein
MPHSARPADERWLGSPRDVRVRSCRGRRRASVRRARIRADSLPLIGVPAGATCDLRRRATDPDQNPGSRPTRDHRARIAGPGRGTCWHDPAIRNADLTRIDRPRRAPVASRSPYSSRCNTSRCQLKRPGAELLFALRRAGTRDSSHCATRWGARDNCAERASLALARWHTIHGMQCFAAGRTRS